MQSYDLDYFQNHHDYLPLTMAQTISKVFKRNQITSVLDLACGTGRLTDFLNSQGFPTTGLDYSYTALKYGRKNKTKISTSIHPKPYPLNLSPFLNASATHLPFKPHSFDAITCISLIEHLNPMQTSDLFSEISRVLTPRGLLFIVTPNFASPIRILRGSHWYGYRDPTHITFYTYQSLTKALKSNQYQPLSYRFPIFYNSPFDWAYVPKYHPQWFQFILNNLIWYSPLAYLRDSIWCLAQKI